MGQRNKQPKRAFDPHPQRQPAAPAAQDWNRQPPSWSFSRVDLEGPWGCGPVDGAILGGILRRLRDFESMTWAEMQQGRRCAAKEIPVEHLSTEARARLVAIGHDDIDSLWELHLAGKPRLWGIRAQATFHLVWFDLDHEVCPSHLRHT
jgi:hypothetical protein